MQAGQATDRYTIAAPREFYAQWLAPRLARVRAANTPTSGFTFVADEKADFTEANLDFAVRLVDGPGELEGVELAPARRGDGGARPMRPSAGSTGPVRLCPKGRSRISRSAMPGRRCRARSAGLGRAMLPYLLVEEALADGRLDGARRAREAAARAYWLVAPLPQWRQRKVRALVAFLSAPD